jgi:S-DNA-T family DNA segregation ATPase FtsK/SpoIIIE
MARKNKRKKNKSSILKKRGLISFSLPEKTKRYIIGLIFFLLAIIFALSFFKKAGVAGKALFNAFRFLIGGAVFIIPLTLLLSGLVFLIGRYKKVAKPLALAVTVLLLGISGILGALNFDKEQGGGWLGGVFSRFLLKFFGFLVTQIIFFTITVIGALILWHLLKQPTIKKEDVEKPLVKNLSTEDFAVKKEKKTSLIKKIFTPSFKVKEVDEPVPVKVEKDTKVKKEPSLNLRKNAVISASIDKEYKAPPLNLLDSAKGQPSAGDIRTNSEIIKKALESFEIPVEMSGVNIGPTVTQYSLKPANGIKLSRITSLSNDLALALATHPIRIEAPIPGKSLVGIEVPNKVRSFIRLKELIENQKFQDSPSNLTFCLGKDVSGNSVYADLGRMPHLLVAGATGTGKTIFLNSLILSLIYRNSPERLRLILIDPKRVEFTVYRNLPHLLCPPIVESARAVNAFKWLIDEMERRFKILSEVGSRNITSYNEKTIDNGREYIPYIVLVVDELADLMAAKGREVESGIVRLAQMARAVGIHLVLATQRPSVEVITGLIKANVTSRITFQVASQVDSRTVLDTSGAEKLLGSGDMLFISSDIVKPKRIQSAYISEKEVRKVIKWIESKIQESPEQESQDQDLKMSLQDALDKNLETAEVVGEDSPVQLDPLYEEAKVVVVQYRKASSSLLQRKLKIGYARAARLIDILEQKGIVGPSRGAKPREVYISDADNSENFNNDEDEDDGWEAV